MSDAKRPGPPEPEDAGGRSAPSLDDVRQELRRLGYLRDPIGGLLLSHSSARATFARASLSSSARAGLLGGLLLAGPLAVALGYLSRPHFQGLRDHMLLAAYLLPLLAGGVFALTLMADLLVRALAGAPGRHGERLAGGMGAILAAASSAYLGLLWGRRLPFGTSGTAALAAGALLILGTGLLIGWIVRSGALVAVLSSGGRVARVGGGRGAFALIALAAGSVGATVFGIAGAGRPHSRPARPLPAIQLARPPGRVIFVGVDGLSASWLDSLLARTQAPALRRVVSGAASYLLSPTGSTVPPEVWTTIATGEPGDVHGVRSFEVHRLLGMRSPLFAAPAARDALGSAFRLLALAPPEISEEAPLSSFLRRSRAVWEIAEAAGLRAAVLNWWGTWPAGAESALTVSDRALGSLLDRASAGAEDRRPAPCEMICPETFEARLRSEFDAERKSLDARLELARGAAAGGAPEPEAAFRAAFTIDAFHLDVAAELLEADLAQAIFVYLPGQDILTGLEPEGDGQGNLVSALRTVARQEALLEELDRGVGRMAALMGPEDLLVLAGDPGRRLRREEGGRARGFLHVYGGRVARPGPAGSGRALDVAPTLLALCGLPQAADLPGRPLPDLEDVVTGPLGSGEVASFGERPVAGWDPSEESAEYLEQLRSLGYIQ